MLVGFLSYLIWKIMGNETLPELLVALTSSTMSYLVSDIIIETRNKKSSINVDQLK